MKLSRILIYPLKSSKGISLNTTNVHALTGREFPKLLGLKTQILNGKLINLSDISPIHLITQASLDDLNSKLSKGDQVSIHTFRPNLVIENEEAFEEDNWKTVQIGNVVFNVHYKATRCSMLQINPITLKNNLNSEPLRTLSKYRRNDKGKVCFGVYLIPRNSGEVHLGDSIIVLK